MTKPIKISVDCTTIPKSVELTGFIIPVPYAITYFTNGSGHRVMQYVGVELPRDYFLEYLEKGKGRFDLDYITAIYPYKNCPIDDDLRNNPKFINRPIDVDFRNVE